MATGEGMLRFGWLSNSFGTQGILAFDGCMHRVGVGVGDRVDSFGEKTEMRSWRLRCLELKSPS
jgi:hypothetical protein